MQYQNTDDSFNKIIAELPLDTSILTIVAKMNRFVTHLQQIDNIQFNISFWFPTCK